MISHILKKVTTIIEASRVLITFSWGPKIELDLNPCWKLRDGSFEP